jgi:hypothetical protein
MENPWEQSSAVQQAERMVRSYKKVTGRDLLAAELRGHELARELFHAPFVVVSHGIEPDPVLNYGNSAALRLWEMSWAELTSTPSRFTAEAPNREERARLLEQVTRRGFIEDYSGVRISKTGNRFRIDRAVVWNLEDEEGRRCGQAAAFSAWLPLA